MKQVEPGAGESDVSLGRRDRKKLETRKALADTALRLVAERGLDNVTVEDISDACDVSSRTFFNYFASKDEAVVGGFEELDLLRQTFVSMPRDMSVLAALRMAFMPWVLRVEADRDTVMLRMNVITTNPQLLPKLMAAGMEAEKAVAAAVRDRLDLPAGDPFPSLVCSVAFTAYRCATLRWATDPTPATGKPPGLAKLLDEAFDAIAAGLPDPVSSTSARRRRADATTPAKDRP